MNPSGPRLSSITFSWDTGERIVYRRNQNQGRSAALEMESTVLEGKRFLRLFLETEEGVASLYPAAPEPDEEGIEEWAWTAAVLLIGTYVRMRLKHRLPDQPSKEEEKQWKELDNLIRLYFEDRPLPSFTEEERERAVAVWDSSDPCVVSLSLALAVGLKEVPGVLALEGEKELGEELHALGVWVGGGKLQWPERPKEERVCPECGRKFVPWMKKQKYHNTGCGRRARAKEQRRRAKEKKP